MDIWRRALSIPAQGMESWNPPRGYGLVSGRVAAACWGPGMTKDEIKEQRESAWIGDAVLALYARNWVLGERHKMDGEWFTALTSNDFLSQFGQPTAVEAKIGEIYRAEGLSGAFEWIESQLIPKFRQRMAKRH